MKITVNGVKNVLIVVLLLAAVVLAQQNSSLREDRAMSAQEASEMAKKLKMKDTEVLRLRQRGPVTVWLTRTVPGGEVSGERAPYIPPEGGADVSAEIMPDGTPKVTVKVKDKGFTARMGYGLIYSEKLYPEIDLKLFYYKRFSAKVGTTSKFLTGGVSRHIDDFVRWLKWHNVEVQGVLGYEFEGKLRPGLGIRSNL